MYVRPPLQLAGLGLLNERYAGPDFNIPGSGVGPGSDPHPVYLEDGIHLRWAFPRRIGWPSSGFQVYRRPALSFVKTSFTVTSKGKGWTLGGVNRSLASIGRANARGFTLNFNGDVAAAIITYSTPSGHTLPPRTLSAYGLTPLGSGRGSVTPTVPNLGDADTPAGDVVVVQPNRVDLGNVYTPLGDALSSVSDASDPFYGAYLAGLFDEDEDHDESFGSSMSGGVPGDNDDDDGDVAWWKSTYPGASTLRTAGNPPWMRQLVVQVPTTAVVTLQIELIQPIDVPTTASWPPSGWTKIADLTFPRSKSEAVGRVLASPYPSDWGSADDPNSTANGLLKVYGSLYDQMVNSVGGGSVTGPPGGALDPNAIMTVNPNGDGPAQGLNAVQVRMGDVLLALSVDHRIARMFGLSYCDATATGAGDYMVAAFWTQSPHTGTPDYLATTFRVPLTHRAPLLPPRGLSGVPTLQGTGHADDDSISTSTSVGLPAVALTWDMQVDVNAADGELQPGAPAAFNLYRAHDSGGHPGDSPTRVNRQPVVVARSRNPKTHRQEWPASFYIDDNDPASPGGFGLMSGAYEYQISGIDIFGRISPASAWTGPIKAPTLGGPPPPVFVTARFLDAHDPFLSDVESAIINGSGGDAGTGSPSAHVIWHWTGDRMRQAIAQSFKLYYLPALPRPIDATLMLRGTPSDGTILADIAPAPPNPGALVGGRLVQGGYDLAFADMGGIDLHGVHVPGGHVQLEPKQWRILSVDRTGTHLVLGRLPDRDGSLDFTTEGIVPANGAVQLRYDLSNRSLWTALPSSVTPFPAGDMPPPPAAPLIAAARAGDSRLILVDAELFPVGTVLLVGFDLAKVAAASGQTITMSNTIPDGRTWPPGTPVTANWIGADVTPGSNPVAIGNYAGLRAGQTIAIGLPPRASTARTALVGNISAGRQAGVQAMSMAGIVGGATLVIDDGDNAEVVVVESATATYFTATFARAHPSGASITIGILSSGAASTVVEQVPGPAGLISVPALRIESTNLPSPIRAPSLTLGPTPTTVQPGSMNGIHTGTVLIVDSGANGETVTVQSTSGSSFTATFTRAHASGTPVVVAQTAVLGSIGTKQQLASALSFQNIVPGSQLLIDSGPAGELVVVTQVLFDSAGHPTQFRATFTQSHNDGAPIAIVNAVETLLITSVGKYPNITTQPSPLVPWPLYSPVSILDVPYDWAPPTSLFKTFGMLPDPARNHVKGQGYFALSTVATSYQDGSPIEGPLSAPARIDTVSYAQPDVSHIQLGSRPDCSLISIVYGDAADVNGDSRIPVGLPPPPGGISTYAEVWRTTEDRVFAATGQSVSLADTCDNHWALMQLADSAIDRSGFSGSETTASSATSGSVTIIPGDTRVQVTDASGAHEYRRLVFMDPNHPGVHAETVTVAQGGVSGGTITFFPPLGGSYPNGVQVLFQSQGMGPFVMATRESVPWTAGGTYTDVIHGLSDNLYLYSFVGVPVQHDATGSHVQASGVRSLASGVSRPYTARPSLLPVVPSPIRVTALLDAGAMPPLFLAIQLQWNYDPPSAHRMDSPPARMYTIYRTTDPDAASDIRLMSQVGQIARYAPTPTTLTVGVSSPGVTSLTLASMTGIAEGATLAVDTGDRYEVVIAHAVKDSAGRITGYGVNFTKSHSAGAPVIGGYVSFVDGVDGHGAVNYTLRANGLVDNVPTPVNYYYRITAASIFTDTAGRTFHNISDASKAVQARAADVNPPPAPTGLRVVRASGGSGLKLTWRNPRPDYQVQVQRRDANNPTFWQTIPLTGRATDRGIAGAWSPVGLQSLLDATADASRSYEYRIVARSSSLYTVNSDPVTYRP